MPYDPHALPSLVNPEQLAAVTRAEGPLLVLAGAGSGKTRVITYRIAHAVAVRGVPPWRVLAVTFTNKAAGEMRERLVSLLGPEASEAWVSTFHAAGANLLRREGQAIGLSRDFVIYDDADTLAELKRVMKAQRVDPKLVDPRRIRARIDDAKNHGRTPADAAKEQGFDEVSREFPRIYAAYQESLRRSNAVDFGDLILRLVELFTSVPEVLHKYRGRFREILVDEFQDTNAIQYRLMKLLAGDGRGLCVVGDDDQAIYKWRGADVKNLLSFPEDFPGTTVVKLEQNYRSTQLILDAAHAVITRNPKRMEKRLWTNHAGGDPLELVVARDERDEADRVASRVAASIDRGVDPAQIAVFYRTNAQSRVIEGAFRMARLPYAVVRGRSFYERAEVKDLASYLRLAVNPRSDADALRVINRPARGIGDTTVTRLEGAARELGVSVVEVCARAAEIPGLNAGARARLVGFAQLVGQIALVASKESAGEAAKAALERSGLEEAFLAEGTDEALDRVENVRELAGAAEEWDRTWSPPEDPGDPDAPQPTALAAFLEQISLLGDADEKIAGPKVALMTLHAAKGLEFEEVFLTGMEEGVFPHSRSLGEDGGPDDLAEERRLCYVGFTRAKKRLVVSLATSRALFGDLKFNAPSRFLGDVPERLFAEAPFAGRIRRAAPPDVDGERIVYDGGYGAGPGPGPGPGEPDIELDGDDGFEGRTIDRSEDQRPERLYARVAAPRPPVRRRPEEVRRAATLLGGGGGPGAYARGTRVRHEQFGVGVVEDASGDKLSVRFAGVGVKRVIARFVQLA